MNDRESTMPTPVHERILELFEAEGIKTLFGIPDPGFIHMAVALRAGAGK